MTPQTDLLPFRGSRKFIPEPRSGSFHDFHVLKPKGEKPISSDRTPTGENTNKHIVEQLEDGHCLRNPSDSKRQKELRRSWSGRVQHLARPCSRRQSRSTSETCFVCFAGVFHPGKKKNSSGRFPLNQQGNIKQILLSKWKFHLLSRPSAKRKTTYSQ